MPNTYRRRASHPDSAQEACLQELPFEDEGCVDHESCMHHVVLPRVTGQMQHTSGMVNTARPCSMAFCASALGCAETALRCSASFATDSAVITWSEGESA